MADVYRAPVVRGESRGATSIAALVEERLLAFSQELVGRTVAVYLERSGEVPAHVRISPAASEEPLEGYSLELRFASWLTCVDAPQLRAVPTFLFPWLRVKRVLVLPLLLEGKCRGAVVVDAAGLGRRDVVHLEVVAAELTAALARRAIGVSEGSPGIEPVTNVSMCRLKNAPPVR